MVSRRFIAWIALCATLFSSASPTLAAVLFCGDTAVLGRILGVPSPAHAADEAAGEHANAAHGHGASSPGASDDGHSGPAHDAHTVYCSFCLTPGSTAALITGPIPDSALDLAYDVAAPLPESQRTVEFFPQYRSRAPPIVS